MVISSILDAGPVWGSLVGVSVSCRISGIDPRIVAELAATAAATAPYFRNSLRETFFSGLSVSWVVISDIDPLLRGEASTPVVQLLTVSMECSKKLETEPIIPLWGQPVSYAQNARLTSARCHEEYFVALKSSPILPSISSLIFLTSSNGLPFGSSRCHSISFFCI